MRAVFLALACASSVASAAPAKPAFLERLSTRADFDRLARTYGSGDLATLPHVLFALDRAPGGKLYFIDSHRYGFHREFLTAQYLTIERGKAFFVHSYTDPDRRFVLGTVVWHASAKRFAWEVWEGDRITAPLLDETQRRLSSAFPEPLAFKPNGTDQERAAAEASAVPVVAAGTLWKARPYRPFKLGRAVGWLRFVRRGEDRLLRPDDIAVFEESPITLAPVAGVVTTSDSTPLAHVHLLARSWHVPDVYVRDAFSQHAALADRLVVLDAGKAGYVLRIAEPRELQAFRKATARRQVARTPRADLRTTRLASLSELRATDVSRYGAKAANLGEVAHAVAIGRVRGVRVPDAFAIPFAHYDRFLARNGLLPAIEEVLTDPAVAADPAVRRSRLEALRARLQAAEFDPTFAAELATRAEALSHGAGLFVRSSTNAEDLPGFNGAGLYTTVPNVRGAQPLVEAVKTVWASLWNLAAFEARERAGIDHRAVRPGVLVQVGVDAEAAGVLLTTNPFDSAERATVYINAKRGLGIRVVEGRKVPEQLVFNVSTRAVRVLTRSEDDTMLSFAPDGGVREVKIEPDRRVLTDAMVVKLADAALQVQKLFGGGPQDIEWLIAGGELQLVQARPFVP